MTAELLVIDDDRNLRETLRDLLTDAGHRVRIAANGREGLALVDKSTPGLILCDWRMPDMGGEGMLRSLRSQEELQLLPVLIMTAYGTGPSAAQAMQLGAYDFLTKPLDMKIVLSTVERALQHVSLQRQLDALREQQFADPASSGSSRKAQDSKVDLIGASPAWIDVFKSVGKVASTNVGVLLLGESGTGKEVVAHAIHELSNRKGRPFIVVNCAALPPELMESELFGHERGSFTSAISQKAGKFEAADGGTIFLDEIGELPLTLQPKLLRVLQEHTFERVGSNKSMHSDVRVIAATNRNLPQEVAEKRFRADLFFRLNAYSVELPPLRERREDIPLLTKYFLHRYANQHGSAPQEVTPDALHVLMQYTFPGNVRELEHIVERTAVQAGGRAITLEVVQKELARSHDTSEAKISLAELLALPYHEAVAFLEAELLRRALQEASGNKSEAARLLGINRRLLYEKATLYQIL